MNKSRKSIVLLLLAVIATIGGAHTAVSAPNSNGIIRKVVEEHAIEGTNRVLQLILVDFPPGTQSPPHTHPAVGLNYIVAGEVDSQYEGEPVKHYKAGDTYQDPKDKKHLLFKNTSQTKALRFLIAVELEKGQSFAQVLPAAAQ